MALTKLSTDVIDLSGNTEALTIPSGTSANRPTSPAEGLLRDNTTTGALEFYNGSLWQQIAGTLVPDFQASSYFNTVIYTGNSTSGAYASTPYGQQDISVGFTSDFSIFKARNSGTSGTSGNVVYDVIRGDYQYMNTNSGSASGSSGMANGNAGGANLSNGVRVGDITDGSFGVNGSPGGAYSNGSYVSWNWIGGGTPTASSSGTSQTPTANSKMVDGVSDTSNWATTTNGYPTTQSVNTSAGFSITQFTKASYGNPCTVPHSLGATPEFIISKIYNTTEDWVVWHKDIGNNYYLSFNRNGGTDGKTSSSFTFTTVDSNIIESQWTNAVQNWVFYAWTSISGLSKFDKYTGSGISGHAIATGFAVGFLIIKRITNTDAYSDWYVFDNKRKTGVYSDQLSLNRSDAESTGTYVELTSTGFTLHTTASNLNNSSSDFIYIAFAG